MGWGDPSVISAFVYGLSPCDRPPPALESFTTSYRTCQHHLSMVLYCQRERVFSLVLIYLNHPLINTTHPSRPRLYYLSSNTYYPLAPPTLTSQGQWANNSSMYGYFPRVSLIKEKLFYFQLLSGGGKDVFGDDFYFWSDRPWTASECFHIHSLNFLGMSYVFCFDDFDHIESRFVLLYA